MARIDSAETSQAAQNATQPPMQLTPDAIKKMTEKLSEMMGEDIGKDFAQLRNEKGELVNEEGLPIIDINEPVLEGGAQNIGPAYFHDGDDYLPNISTLPSAVRERLRRERESLLDQLEVEEQREQSQEHEAEKERKREILEKRKQEGTDEKEKLKASRELQKKMGRALLQNLAKERAEEQRQEAEQLQADEETQRTRKISTGPKKTVSFADIPTSSKGDHIRASMLKSPPPEPSSPQEWPKGDVTFARLRPKTTTTPPLSQRRDNQPMKMTVVERFPVASRSPAPLMQPSIVTTTGDSDDESEPEVDTEEDIPAEGLVDNTSDNDSDGDMSLEEEDTDLDFARHQREVALEYHEKRNKIGQTALEAMKNLTHDLDEDLPSDVHLPQQDKPPLSKFKASRLASSYGAATAPSPSSTSLGAAIVPEAAVGTIRAAIRTGKLDDEERLVGGDDDSADEYENEGLQEVLDLLKKGQIYAAGPDAKEFYAVPPPQSSTAEPTSSTITDQSKIASKPPFPDLAPIDRPKASKFKLSRAAAGRSAGEDAQASQTEIAQQPSTMRSTVLERPISSSPAKQTQSSIKPSAAQPTMKSAVLERPVRSPPSLAQSAPAASSGTVELPSFPPSSGSNAEPQFNPFSMIVDSPSFPNPSGPPPHPNAPSNPRADNSRPSRPPIVMSSTVKESTRGSTSPPGEFVKPKKVSRFMAERG